MCEPGPNSLNTRASIAAGVRTRLTPRGTTGGTKGVARSQPLPALAYGEKTLAMPIPIHDVQQAVRPRLILNARLFMLSR
jgi:hypothetical protein